MKQRFYTFDKFQCKLCELRVTQRQLKPGKPLAK